MLRIFSTVAVITLSAAVFAVAAPARDTTASSSADNFGGVSAAYQAQMKALIYKTFGHGWQGETMIRCARRESGFNPRAANYHDSNGGSYGLLQLNGVHRWRGESIAQFRQRMWNPITHLAAAKRLARGGLGPWGGGC